ncbi:MAG: hypothetical protein H0T93_12775 [Chloroflexia bacterium]|nr:hypothetical protein [Chloroflexia bacterium]
MTAIAVRLEYRWVVLEHDEDRSQGDDGAIENLPVTGHEPIDGDAPGVARHEHPGRPGDEQATERDATGRRSQVSGDDIEDCGGSGVIEG